MTTQVPQPEGPVGRPSQETTAPPATAPRATAPPAEERTVVARPAPSFAPMAILCGWLCAWGAAILAAVSLREAGAPIGMGLGLLDGEDAAGFWAGLWLLIIQVGAFVLGGYAAARIARGRGLLYAVGAWVLAMLATGGDAIAASLREGQGVLARLELPFWADTGLGPTWKLALVLAIFALAGLVGALIGGALGTLAERGVDRPARRREGALPATPPATPGPAPGEQPGNPVER